VQDISNLSGKMLRLDPLNDYQGAAENPFFDASDPNRNASKVFYYGLRNPYRFTFDPLTGLPVVGDVGASSFEEVNTGPPGSNFGWPYFEGPEVQRGYSTLQQARDFYANGNVNPGSPDTTPAVLPLLSLSHLNPENATAITQGDFYNDNTLIFGDVRQGTIFEATLGTDRSIETVSLFDTLPGPGGLVDLRMGPDNLLYAVSLGNNTIYRWTPSEASSQFVA
jgi:glucose/arabinose dehydrogenase